jgi:hypothetical protein
MEFHPVRTEKSEKEEICFSPSFTVESAHIAPARILRDY